MSILKGPLKRRFEKAKDILDSIGRNEDPLDDDPRVRPTISWWTKNTGEVVFGRSRLFQFNTQTELIEWLEEQKGGKTWERYSE